MIRIGNKFSSFKVGSLCTVFYNIQMKFKMRHKILKLGYKLLPAATILIIAILMSFYFQKYFVIFFIPLLILSSELALLKIRKHQTGRIFPFAHDVFGLLEFDNLLIFNLSKNFSTERLWNKSSVRREKIESYKKGMGKRISINSMRYRGQIVEPEKNNNKIYRIVVLGDSISFGALNDDEYTWPYLLEKKLNAIFFKDEVIFEVLNFSVGGYKIEQCVKRYVRDYSHWDVDLLINACFVTDFKYYSEISNDEDLEKQKKEFKKYYSQQKCYQILSNLWTGSLVRSNWNLTMEIIAILKRKFGKDDKSYALCDEDYEFQYKRYEKLFDENRPWLQNYSKWFAFLYKKLQQVNPKVMLFSLVLPVLLGNQRFLIRPHDYSLPKHLSYSLYNGRGYNSENLKMINLHSRYLALSYFFPNYLRILTEKLGCNGVFEPIKTIYRMPFCDRSKYFFDEYHLSNCGNELMVEELANQVKNVYFNVPIGD
jgi:hypothetical protein